MGNFAILRVQKVKTMSSMAARGRHNFREQDTPNADPEMLGKNLVVGAKSTDEMLKAISDLMPTKRRKDAVIGLEYLITASPEHFASGNQLGYFNEAVAWLEAKHGKANVVCKTIHLDESTPHLAAFVVPLVGGKLNAKFFTGGAKVLADMQTDFAEKVGKNHNLERGVERSSAVHQDNAKIKPMVVERLELKKQVKALSAEIERLTKAVTDGGASLTKLQAQFALQQKLNIDNFHVINRLDAEKKGLKAENEELKNDVIALKTQIDAIRDLNALEAIKTTKDIDLPQPAIEKPPEGVSVAPDGGFSGRITAILDGYIIQNLGRDEIAHRIADLGLVNPPKVGQYLEIKKRDGQSVAKVDFSKGLSR